VFEWRNLRREGSNSDRDARRALYYPIYIDGENIRIPEMTWNGADEEWNVNETPRLGEQVVYPDNESGVQKTWRWGWKKVSHSLRKLAVRKDRSGRDYIYYKRRPNEAGVVSVSSWFDAKYSATEHGTAVIKSLFGRSIFSFPKSIHAVKDAVYISGGSKDDAIVLDFFGGSGTTAHAVISLNRENGGDRRYLLVEMGDYFDSVLKPRVMKAIYSKDWEDGKPVSREGLSHCFKYLRLESYEDAVNNLTLDGNAHRAEMLGGEESRELRRDYILNYFLDVETRGSSSLLNVSEFSDPTAYTLRVKRPGGDEQVPVKVDLVETFNWLIGLDVALLDRPRTYSAEFERAPDPDLPEDQHTRLVVKGRLKEADEGIHWFRIVEGTLRRSPDNDADRDKVLVIWRKLTNDPEKDAAVLEALLAKYKINQTDSEFDTIYINGPHGLSLSGQAKARLLSLEDAFMSRMWADVDGGELH
jgi:adenine-specific DNA-methyltransferase